MSKQRRRRNDIRRKASAGAFTYNGGPRPARPVGSNIRTDAEAAPWLRDWPVFGHPPLRIPPVGAARRQS